jgi:hypothetical protein
MNTGQLYLFDSQNKFIVNCCRRPLQHIKNVINKDNNGFNPMNEWYYMCDTCKSKWKYETNGNTIFVKSL